MDEDPCTILTASTDHCSEMDVADAQHPLAAGSPQPQIANEEAHFACDNMVSESVLAAVRSEVVVLLHQAFDWEVVSSRGGSGRQVAIRIG